jgi:hypothetical protein
MTWINVTDEDRQDILNAILHTPGDTKVRLLNLVERIDEMKAETAAYAPQIAEAEERYALGSSDNIEIDPDPPVSPGGDPGVWVGAWVWVPMKEEEDDEEASDDEEAKA